MGEASPAPIAQTYLVQLRDCLARIAQKAFGRQDWVSIYRLNRIRFKNPDLIYPGQLLIIPEPARHGRAYLGAAGKNAKALRKQGDTCVEVG